ncbi:hypothetical protein OJAV_G00211230 [Oryzias javanicus]|uniref:Calponin-homology (CH) domain-containing protein n=1 Tax=Oryzias javanicus TaxID=123683 RepID=A0A3S2TWC0_ORYJA|nr:hypothetical protein OJAV_G00211230 [Oryzias javanicus]
MSSQFHSGDDPMEGGSLPLDIDNVHMLLQVEQEQIQKRTFTNWVNAQLAKRRPPCRILDLFSDFRDGSRLLDLLEVMSGQRISRDRGRGMFQHRSNIEKALAFLKKKSVKLVNINIPDIMDGKPSIILGLIWTIILQYHIEELASCLSFDSRQSSMESLASLDTRSTLSSRSASASPAPARGSPLHHRFRVSARKALLLWVREQCHRAGCSVNVKDFKASWRSGVVFLAVMSALRPDLVDLSRARTRSNKQNLEEAFRIAEKELRIPRLLDPEDVDVRDPDEKSIMTYVAQFLQYSRDFPAMEEESQTQYLTPPKCPSPVSLPVHYTPAVSASPLRKATPDRKAQEVTCWLGQAYDELLEGWDSTEGESYSERYHVFQTFVVSFNEQRRPIMPLLTAMRRSGSLSEEQRALREAWDALSEKLREYRVELDMSLPPPLDTVGSWLLRTEAALVEEQGEPQDHGRAADEAREKQELLRVCLEEMPQQMKTFQSFKNMDEYGNMMVPSEKMDELKRRFTSVRVTAKYHGIKLEYREHRHTVLDLLGQIRTKLHIWKKPFISSEAVRVLMQECHEIVNVQEIPSLLESALQKLKQISEKYSNKSALAADYHQVSQQVKQLEEETAAVLREVPAIRSTMGQVLSAWDSYDDSLSSFQAWLEQNSVTRSSNSRPLAASDSVAEWTAQHSRLNELGSFLMGSTDPQSSRNLAEELRKLNLQWEEFLQTEPSEGATESVVDQTNAQNLQALIREATLILKKPLEVKAGPLRTYRKRLQFIIRKIKDVDLDLLSPSPEFPSEPLQKVKLATPEIVQTLLEAEQVCVELQLCVSGLDSRLAELLHWEGEARELHRVLKASDRHLKQQGQDPRARATISRGLQLEGQVVTEEQDLQVLVMTSQKNSPIQYIHATTLHDRVQAAVAQSQEAIGMLSSLGARRDRSRSPPEVTPPSKVFIQAKGNAQQLKEQTQHPKMNTLPAQFGDASVPSIVVQEYRGETMMSPPMPFNPEQAVTASPPQGQIQTRSETSAEAQEPEHSLQIQDQNKQNKNEDLRQETKNQKQKQVTKVDQQQVEQSSEGATLVQDQQELKTSNQKVAAKKLSSKELQSRKIQAMKNRPWLQKTALGQQKSTNPNSASSPAETQKLQEVPSRSTKQTQQRKDDQQRQINPPSKVKQQKEKLQQQEKEQQPDNQKLQSGGKHAQANSGTKTKVQNPQSAVQPQAQPVSNSSKDNQQAGNVQLTEMKETEIPDLPQPHDSLKVQSMSQPPTQLSLHPGTQHQPQMFVPAGCELSVQPQGLVHAPAFAQHQIRPQISSSPQAPLPVHIQTPVPSHIQLRSHPQTWAPVRPPSPKPPSQNFSQPAGSHGNLQTSIQQQIQPQLRSQSQVQVCPPSVGYPQDQTHGKANTTFAHPEVKPNPIQPLVNPQIQGRGTDHRPLHPVAGPVAQWSTHASTPSPQQGLNAQGQMQVWTQVKASSSVRVQGPQAAGQHQLYPQAQIPSQQHQPISPPRHPVPQPYSQHSQTQTFAAVQASQQWPKQDPQINPYDYSHMGALYGQPPIHPQMLAQTWTQTQPQNIPQGPISQIPQMGPYNVHQKEQGLVPPQTGVQRMPQVHQQHPQNFLPVQHQLQTQLYQTQSQMQSQIQIQPMPSDPLHSPFTSAAQLQARIETRPESHQGPSPVLLQQPTSHSQLPQPFLQLSNQPKPQIKSDASPQPEGLVQFSPSTSKPQVQPLTQNQDGSLQKSQVQMPGQHMALPPNKSEMEWPQQARVEAQAEVQPSTQPTLESVGQVPKQSAMTTTEAEATPQPPVQSGATSKPEVQALPRFTADSQTQAEIQTLKQPKSQDHQPQQNLQQTQTTAQPKVQFPPETKPDQNLSQSKSQSEHPVQPKSQQPQPSPPLKVHMQPKVQAESPDFQKAPALAQAPPQAYTEAYSRAQALARNGFEEAKRCLQAHIMDIISVFQEKSLSAGQTSVTQETLKTLDPELLEEFLRAAEGMEAFCTPSQLRDMELFTQSVRTQWEACFSADIVGAGKDLDALNISSVETTTKPSWTQRFLSRSAKSRALRRSPRNPVRNIRFQLRQLRCLLTRQKDRRRRALQNQAKRKAFERYENCKKTLQAQLGKNEQSLQELPSDSVSLKGLHTRLQEIQFMRQETESLWSEYMNQCSQLGEDVLLEQERTGLQDQWRSQQTQLQRRGSSLGTALRQIDSTENHMVDFSERLDRYLRQPKDVSGFSLAKSNILRDIKELDDNIQSELDQLSRLNPESCELDPRECFPLIREVETHKASLDQLRQQVRKSEAAARALDHFLMSLRTLDEDISGVQGAPCSDGALLQECRAKLALIRQSIDSLKEKAPQLDLLLQGARLTVTRDGGPASCLDMVSTLLRRQEEADGGLAGQQRSLQKESQSKSLGLRKRKMMGELQKLEETVEKQDLKEPTIPAVQHMLRSLLDLEGQLQTLHSELQVLREQQDRPGGGENLLQELETQWNNTQRSFFERKNVCNSLLELLKKFQMSRSQLSNTIQKAEQTISEQASYMGKDNLQRCMSRVCDMKEELGGLSQQIEELKKFPACSEPCFEAEADSLMDSWLDLTEKIDGFMDNLQVGLELWEKQLMLGGEVDSWAGAKLALFAESHPFQQEQQVLDMRDEIRANEENIAHFHKKSLEIQEMLQSQEAPLELQVMETQLRKRMEQVKELFTDCTDVFEELTAVRKHLTEKVKECQTAVDNIQHCLRRLDSSQPAAEAQMQAQCDTLQCQEERVEALLREMGMVSSVASPLVLEELTADCSTLKENIAHTKAMIQLRREEREQGTLKVIREKQQSFEESFQDLQLSVNECFENPESRSDVETNVHRLSGFLKSKDAERRLEQLEDQLRRCSGPERSELSQWLKEQQEEVSTFTSHCLSRQRQMEALLSDLERLQQQHDDFCEWIHSEEQRSVGSEDASGLLRDLHAGSEKAEALSELMASVRRQGVRAENLLKEGDNAIQRYRNLEARLQNRVQVQDALRSQLCHFETQAESTKSWISQLLQPLTAPGSNSDPETLKSKALALLNSRAEGEAKVSDLRTQMERLSEQEEFEESRKQEVQQVVRDAEKALRSALSAAEEALRKAETQALLDKQLAALQSKNDSLRSWIEDLSENLASLRDHQDPEEKLKIAQTVLSSRSTGEIRLQDLKEECQTLCDNKGLTEDATQMISSAVRKTEEQWWEVLRAAGAALKQAEEDAASVRNFEAFKAQTERVQTWIREQRQKLLDLGSHAEFEERLQTAQAFRSLTPEGDSKLQDLKTQGERLCEPPQGSRTPEVQQLVTFTEQQWTSVLQILRQVELRALSDDFNAQTKATEAWVREQEQKLEAVGCHGPPEDRDRAAKAVLTSRPEGDFKVNNLRRRGQSVCDHQDADEARRVCVQQSVKETEQQWRKLLESAKQLQAAAEADISQETERKMSEWREFNTSMEETECWLEDLLQQLDSGRGRAEAQDRLRAGQAIVNSESETESRLRRLAAQAQRVCHQDLEEHKKQEVKQKVKDTEERWTRILDAAKQVVSQAERRCALEHQLKDLQALREDFRKRLEERQRSLLLQDSLADPEEAINTAKDVLSFKPDGDSRLAALRRQCQSLLDQEGLEEQDRREALETLQASEEQWKTLLEAAERSLQRAEVRYSLCRELEAFCTHAGSTESWIGGLQTRADAMRGGTQGSKAQIEERLNIAQTILSSRSQGSAQLMELKRRAQSLYEHEDLEEDRRVEVQQKVGDMEEQWRTLVQNAEDTERELQALVERLLSCQYKRGQAETRLAELQKQLSNLQCVFPWPGLGERRQAVDQARTLLEQSAAVAPLLSDVRTQAAELMEITKDQSWADPCWTVEGGAIAALQSELTALIQTVTREQREMKELDSARDSLLNLCTPAGQDALNLEVSKLYDLQAGSEKEVRERMAACELRLEESDRELARMAGELKERAAALQWELRSLDQALSYSEPQNNIAQLQQHWHSLQNCENSLEDLGVKVQELHQEVQQTSVTKELPAEILSLVESLCQQHTSLRSRLSEHLETCSAKACICKGGTKAA